MDDGMLIIAITFTNKDTGGDEHLKRKNGDKDGIDIHHEDDDEDDIDIHYEDDDEDDIDIHHEDDDEYRT
ncbi:hypothetical protein PoB_001864200 [Plakobranchus ocellatus]|uniref:Uncharacterized protein n=1 Tax=Plakobranchus ocellatus TaxID=259542 RepID=A0AAV3ZC87_9GAST|nr:hypothetical protein PoB_001864200 [Plakobranchus ocellatus]